MTLSTSLGRFVENSPFALAASHCPSLTRHIDYYGVTFDHLVPADNANPKVLQINIIEMDNDKGAYANEHLLFVITPIGILPGVRCPDAQHFVEILYGKPHKKNFECTLRT
jgi:hypothetical protein